MAVKPNKQTYIDFILGELNNGNVQYTSIMLAFVSKFELTEQTFVRYWNTANELYKEAQNSLNEVLNKEIQASALEGLKIGLKTKQQRTLEKQKDIKLLRDSVESGLTDDYYIADGQYITYQRPLTMVEKATILKRASEIESEISKIEADYAPLKTANTDSEGNDVPAQIVIVNSVPEMKEIEG